MRTTPLPGRDVDVIDDLREHDRGEGAWVDDFHEAVAEAFAQPDSAARDGWETLSETRRRVVGVVRQILGAYPGRDVVLVGHGTAWTLLAAELTATEPDLERWRALTMPGVIVVRTDGRTGDRERHTEMRCDSKLTYDRPALLEQLKTRPRPGQAT